jgi:hypothetical protein
MKALNAWIICDVLFGGCSGPWRLIDSWLAGVYSIVKIPNFVESCPHQRRFTVDSKENICYDYRVLQIYWFDPCHLRGSLQKGFSSVVKLDLL